MNYSRFGASMLALALSAGSAATQAQSFPAKPIRMVSGIAGVTDALARSMAQGVSESLGQPVVVDPVLGAGGSLAAQQVARSTPDGYTLLVTYPDPLVLRHLLVKSVPYDTLKDFTPVTILVDSFAVFAVRPEMPVGSLKEFIDYAKANPKGQNYGSGGYGSSFQMAGEALKQYTGIPLTYVPYKSTVEAMNGLLRGELDFLPTGLSGALPLAKASKIKLLAMVNNQRASALPDVPATREVVPSFSSPPYWIGVVGPARLPAPVLQRLNAEIAKAMQATELHKRATDLTFTVVGNSPEDFARRLESEIQYMAKVARAAGIQPQD
jgi:tripartite-type tricarboxylate transporter receptor subunit TctC